MKALSAYKTLRRKWLLSGFILIGILLVFLPGMANARLSVSSPDGTLERADLIITGTVLERNYEDEQRQVTVEINEVLKGTFEEKQLKLDRKKEDKYRRAGFDFPEAGTKIFLLLGGDETRGYWPAGDLNFLAIVDDGYVSELYNGSKIGINDQSWTQEDYATAYDAFYQAHRPSEEATPPNGSRAAPPDSVQPGPPAQPSREESGFFTRWREFFRSLWGRITEIGF